MNLKKFYCYFFILLTTGLNFGASAIEDSQLTAPSVVLMEPESGSVLFEKNAHEIRVCASITKIMTVLLVVEAIDAGKISVKDMVPASEHAASMGGSDIWLKPGESMSVDQLLKATIVASANDAAVVLAEHVAGTETAFVQQMNKRAKILKMNDTVFKNCNGLDQDGHVTSAYDVALMSRELIKHPQVLKYTSIWIDYLRDGKTQLVNTNKLLKSYKGITGLKTGTTTKAGCCFSATAFRDNLNLNAVVLGAKTSKDRFSDATALLDFGFSNFVTLKPSVPENFPSEIKVCNGMTPFAKIKLNCSGKCVLKKGQEKKIKHQIELISDVCAPIEKNQILGKVVFSVDNSCILEYNILSEQDVPQMNFKQVFALLFKDLLKG